MMQDPGFWLQLAIVVWNIGLTGAVWLRKPGTDAANAVNALRIDVDSKFESQNKTIAQIQTNMAHMPNNEDLAQLEGTVKEINERSAGLARNMDAVRASLSRVEDYLLRERRP